MEDSNINEEIINPEDAVINDSRISELTEKKIIFWKEKLQDMTGRNRLLFFRANRSSTLEITHPELQDFYDYFVVRGKTMEFPVPDIEEPNELFEKDESNLAINEIGVKQLPNKINRILYNLRTRSKSAQEERGISVLYLAMGFLKWQESEFSEFSEAPIVMIPISLDREGLGSAYKIQIIEEDIILNPSLDVKLRNDFRLTFPEVPDFINSTDLNNYFDEISGLISGYEGWKIINKSAISIFNFQNLILINDLEKNSDLYSSNPLIQALSSGQFNQKIPDDIVDIYNIDDKVSIEDTVQVLDADSSQQEAIEAAKSGIDLIIQGPPGTGKSQTIANIIAEFLGRNKKVLFVSQKMAALEVVHKRLNQVGLGEFCLEVHSHKTDKKTVIEDLGKSLNGNNKVKLNGYDQIFSRLKDVKRKLNKYDNDLHNSQNKLELSPFDLYGLLAQLENQFLLKFDIPNFENTTNEIHNSRLSIIQEFTNFGEILDNYSEFIWKGANFGNLSIQDEELIEDTLERMGKNIEIFQSLINDLALTYNVNLPDNFKTSFNLLSITKKYLPSFFGLNLEDLLNRFNTEYNNIFRIFNKNFKADKQLIISHRAKENTPKFQEIKNDLEIASQFDSLDTNNKNDPVSSLAESILEIEKKYKEISLEYKKFSQNFLLDKSQDFIKNFYQIPLIELQQNFNVLKGRVDLLKRFEELKKLTSKAFEIELKSFFLQSIKNNIPTKDWENIFLKRFYLLLLDFNLEKLPDLNNFNGVQHNQKIQEFRELDIKRIEIAKGQIRATLLENKTDASWMKASSSEEAILRREMNKKRRIKPLRKIFQEIPELLLELKPCLMMSPLTVSQLLDADLYKFDLVIFDEASQLPPEYAVGAFARAKNVVIAGDRHQLPPTSFFQSADFESSEEDITTDDFESILNECNAIGMPSKMLNWHYRSQDESLIAFSNYHFYDNRLYTFPSALGLDEKMGVEFHPIIDGVYKRGAGGQFNIIEAREVAKGIIEHYQKYPDFSLGVITFNHSQKRMIEEQLEKELANHPKLRHIISGEGEEPLFVKSLEMVQGDERDYIFFSVGFGKDEGGKFLLNFGPLNRIGGERRLNVAVTRSKRGVRIYSSIQPEDIDLERVSNKGPKLLRKYMELARDGLRSIYADVEHFEDAEFDSPFEKAVYDALVNRGLQLKIQVGVSNYRIDIVVVDEDQPGKYLLGIECDGATYHSAATARDRDRIRQGVLENLGWKIHRIWSRDWFNDSAGQINKVLDIVERIKNNNIDENPPEKEIFVSEDENPFEELYVSRIFDKTGVPKGMEFYNPTPLTIKGYSTNSLYNSSSQSIIELIKMIVDFEGPIVPRLVKNRIALSFNIAKKTKKFDNFINGKIKNCEYNKKIILKDGFLIPLKSKLRKPRIPGPGGEKRKIFEITLKEISMIALICVKTAKSISPSDLVKEIGGLLNLRVTKEVKGRIVKAARILETTGEIIWKKDKIRLPKNE
jgi:superfamily I DNA and/or RNA helicase/very-short-patch-repair endonuclease